MTEGTISDSLCKNSHITEHLPQPKFIIFVPLHRDLRIQISRQPCSPVCGISCSPTNRDFYFEAIFGERNVLGSAEHGRTKNLAKLEILEAVQVSALKAVPSAHNSSPTLRRRCACQDSARPGAPLARSNRTTRRDRHDKVGLWP